MIILEKPYVSEFLQQTVVDLQIPVLKTEFSYSLPMASAMNLKEPQAFFGLLNEKECPQLYSNSENSTDLLNQFAPEHSLTRNVNYFKDKSKLRELFSKLNPDVWYKTCKLDELHLIDFKSLQTPFVIKPLRGFASIGIHSVYCEADWALAIENIKKEVVLMRNVFPDRVVSLNEFLLERYIDGTEIAIDAYFNELGEPVILNILTHLFSSKADMSDRLYLTSADIIRRYHGSIQDYLLQIAKLSDLRNFPFHLEMRQEANGNFVPIEINPMRFMGFCVADVEHYFYGINPYLYYFRQLKPDWEHILATRSNSIYGMFGIDIPKHLDKSKISFDYDKFIHHFSHPLHHVKMDYHKFPMAIYLFAETTKDNFSEFEEILYSDLMEYIIS
jgi:hypothetical protein